MSHRRVAKEWNGRNDEKIYAAEIPANAREENKSIAQLLLNRCCIKFETEKVCDTCEDVFKISNSLNELRNI